MPDPTTTAPAPAPALTPIAPSNVGAPKSGHKTTEFWLTLLTIALGAATLTGIIPSVGEAAQIAAFATMVLGAYGYTWNRTKLKAAHATAGSPLAPFAPFDDGGGIDPTSAPAVAIGVAAKVAAMLAVFVLGAAPVTGCGAKQGSSTTPRDTLITTVVTSVNALGAGFQTYDKRHQDEIVAGATSIADGKAKLDAYRARRDAIIVDLKALDVLVKDAKAAKDDASLANVIAAASQVQVLVSDLEGSK